MNSVNEDKNIRAVVEDRKTLQGWQPIRTAPVNKSVLIFIPSPTAEHYGPAIYRGLQAELGERRIWKVTGLHFGSDCGTSNHPSHWMPLPDPPVSLNPST